MIALFGFIGVVLVILGLLEWLAVIHLAVAFAALLIVGGILIAAAWFFGQYPGGRINRRL